MATSTHYAFAGALKDWRGRRRLSQLDLGLEAEVSARHISFLETGRSKPSRDMVLHLCDVLDVPPGERNALLHTAGFAAAYPAAQLNDVAMRPFARPLTGHSPATRPTRLLPQTGIGQSCT